MTSSGREKLIQVAIYLFSFLNKIRIFRALGHLSLVVDKLWPKNELIN